MLVCMEQLLIFIKKIIPQKLFKKLQPAYHYTFNFLAALFYFFPSRKMIVIGVTGTTGKTTIVYLLAHALKNAGLRVGYTSTAMFSDGKEEWLNDKKMTMLGRFFTQRMLRSMLRNKCDVAIVETTSEGIVQFRHRFINYDTVIFTGIYPEHIDSHGSFENYKQAKLKLFEHLVRSKEKKVRGITMKKTIIANRESEYVEEFFDHAVARKIGYGVESKVGSLKSKEIKGVEDLIATNISIGDGATFRVRGVEYHTTLLGSFTISNLMAVIATGYSLTIESSVLKKGIESVTSVPGRLERIDSGQSFDIIVDYAFEPVAVTKLYETIARVPHQKIIHVLGSAGGGRDVARRAIIGGIAGERADHVIVTNEDPYDDDPMEIIEAVAKGARDEGKKDHENLFLIEDRKEAITKALSLAQKDDIVLITGKGSEQAIVVKDQKKIPWDDRSVVRKALKELE